MHCRGLSKSNELSSQVDTFAGNTVETIRSFTDHGKIIFLSSLKIQKIKTFCTNLLNMVSLSSFTRFSKFVKKEIHNSFGKIKKKKGNTRFHEESHGKICDIIFFFKHPASVKIDLKKK